MNVLALMLTTALALGAPTDGEVWGLAAEPAPAVAEASAITDTNPTPAVTTTTAAPVAVDPPAVGPGCLRVHIDGDVITGYEGVQDGSIRVGIIYPYLWIWIGDPDANIVTFQEANEGRVDSADLAGRSLVDVCK